jgi:hypothetical protein
MRGAWAAGLLALAAVGPAQSAEPNPNLAAILVSRAEGYAVHVRVNDVPVTLFTGGRQSFTLYNPDHPKKWNTPPAGSSLFCLRRGANNIIIRYERTDPKAQKPPVFLLQSMNFPGEIFNFAPTNRKADTISAVFEVWEKTPDNFKTQRLESRR